MKNRALRFIDSVPLMFALFFGIGLGLAPFVPEPHLVEKTRMLFEGTLTRPLDIFDLFMHLAPRGAARPQALAPGLAQAARRPGLIPGAP
ncbi:hypothetical protein Tgr7_1956 [Thioalkalivibrio sulfidiphilus HL-EbGr7]|uniref:RND transporter n=1 Tax=Thioalkalivibrio sulfidiphilus (strain HL-EbGR7) TaxID=396588 RepID=B8GT22_THISH|nr:hypothetical protein Tgr7_1956 [Thioalkalivibrio sulfidiphilus HL-EbGr7]